MKVEEATCGPNENLGFLVLFMSGKDGVTTGGIERGLGRDIRSCWTDVSKAVNLADTFFSKY